MIAKREVCVKERGREREKWVGEKERKEGGSKSLTQHREKSREKTDSECKSKMATY